MTWTECKLSLTQCQLGFWLQQPHNPEPNKKLRKWVNWYVEKVSGMKNVDVKHIYNLFISVGHNVKFLSVI